MNTATRTDRITTSLTRTQADEIRECLDAIDNRQIRQWAAQRSEYGEEHPYPVAVGAMTHWLHAILRDAEGDA